MHMGRRMGDRPIFTYQIRPLLDAQQEASLDAYAELYGRAERRLFAAMQAGGTINDLKREFLPKLQITARQFNALRVGLEGKVDSIKARRPELITELQSRIKKATKVVAILSLKPHAPTKSSSWAARMKPQATSPAKPV